MQTRYSPGRYVTLLMLCALPSSCGPEDDGAGEPRIVVTDSAGVRMVQNHGPTDELTVREMTRFGLVDGDPNLLFNEIRSIAVEPDGSLWVTDSHESIRHYTVDGVYLGSVGGSGEGPGESRRGYGDIWVTDSTLYASAYSQGTFQLFDHDGGFIGSRPVYADNGFPLVPLGPSVDDWYFLNIGYPPPEQIRGREIWTLYRGPAAATDLELVTEFEGHPSISVGPGHWGNASFFDGFPSLGVDRGGTIYYSHATEYRIDIFSGAGSLLERIRRSTERRPYEEGLEAEIEDGLRDGWRSLGSTVDEAQIRQMLEAALPVTDPEWIPAVDQVLVAADGALWVRRADMHPRPAMRAVAAVYGYVPWAWLEEWRADWRFDLFSAQGEYRGSVTLPSSFSPMVVTGSHVYGSVRDDLDVEYVVGFEVVPDQSPSGAGF